MLSLLAQIYGRVANARNLLYEARVFESFDLGVRTISIGNITTGGTGKTPLVAHVANILAERGETVCILTRGYGRKEPSKRVVVSDYEQLLADPADAGDEPFELAQKLLGKAAVIADADRVAAAEWARRKFGVTSFVLDDGFQHRRANRDVDIVCIDATKPFGGGQMLPAGRLREPVENLKRADAIVITRSDMVENISDLRSQISAVASTVPVFTAKSRILGVRELGRSSGEAENSFAESIKGERALAFCGLGNPENFYSLLRSHGFKLLETKTFRDHHRYTRDDVSEIQAQAQAIKAQILVTTAKDAVKLSDLKFEIPCYVVEIDIEIDDPAAFAELL